MRATNVYFVEMNFVRVENTLFFKLTSYLIIKNHDIYVTPNRVKLINNIVHKNWPNGVLERITVQNAH